MCGRYSLINPSRLAKAFPRLRAGSFSEIGMPRYNIAPSQAVIGARDGGRNAFEALRWGLYGRINVRAESLTARRGPVGRRCVVFTDGFYEWHQGSPVRFSLQSDEPFALAGGWEEPASDELPECAIVTCSPNALVAPVHDRMPAIVPPDVLPLWLSGDAVPADVVRAVLTPFAAAAMRAQPVSKRLNDARYDAPDILRDDDPVQQSLGFS
jgi:putative SOS response-associated peptidase YedK